MNASDRPYIPERDGLRGIQQPQMQTLHESSRTLSTREYDAGPADAGKRLALAYFTAGGCFISFPEQRLFRWFGMRPLVYLDSIGYAAFMYHLPILTFAKPRIAELFRPQWHALSHIAVLSLIIGLPHLSQFCLKCPLLRLKNPLLARLAVSGL